MTTSRRGFLVALLAVAAAPALAGFNLVPVASAVVNARDYGLSEWATGAENTAAIQRAIRVACDSGGGTVYFPRGGYTVARLPLPLSVTFVGLG